MLRFFVQIFQLKFFQIFSNFFNKLYFEPGTQSLITKVKMSTRSGCNYSNSSDNSQSVLPRDWLCYRLSYGGIKVLGEIMGVSHTFVTVYDGTFCEGVPFEASKVQCYETEFLGKGFFVVAASNRSAAHMEAMEY
jgi:hypothetical protein